MKEMIVNKSCEKYFENILRDIKTVKIQGAENVAKAGIKAFLLNPTKKSAKKILSTRPTEPLLQNSIKILLKSTNTKDSAIKILSEIEESHKRIVQKGAKLIRKGMNIYTHCHSSTVLDILKFAKKFQKKDFVVYTTEVEPLLQGRKTAKELAKSGIKVIIFPDLSAEIAMKKCDLFLFGADAFSKKYVANKIGTSTLVRIAKIYGIPRFSCGISLKFTKKIVIEKRAGKEVWDEREKNIEVENFAFDKTRLTELSGVISELGILSSKTFVKEAREKLKRFGKEMINYK
jgi:translation initiation factor 2B subunit (eIF-2B alpha/beta/delta family)